MAQFNYNTREIIAKVVYYGPSVGGKTTNLQWLHNKLDPRSVGKLFSLETEADRTLFFDLLPINLGNIKGMDLRLKVYTVPGQVKYNSTRKMVLTGADAVAFVADSDVKRHKENVESLKNLAENLAANGLNIRTIPLVLQYNKRDLPNILPLDVMDKKLNFRGLPSFGSVAVDQNNLGALDCFIAVLVSMVESFGEKYKIGKSSEEIKRITQKLEKNLREHVERSTSTKPGKKQREEEGPGKFVIKPKPPRNRSLHF
ncbi:MAG: gliding-motility protein MglA [bacterium]|nr:gliding-motility protein MglA [bacterium]